MRAFADLKVHFMLDYLGFPDTPDDVDKLMTIVDWALL